MGNYVRNAAGLTRVGECKSLGALKMNGVGPSQIVESMEEYRKKA